MIERSRWLKGVFKVFKVRSVLALVQVHLSHTSQIQCAVCTSCQRMGKGVVAVDVNVWNPVGPEQDVNGRE